MAEKSVSFRKQDKELIEEIKLYQHKHQIDSFTEAVRRLCGAAIKIDKINNER